MSESTVGELARLAHVSIRTLHHYDAVGLLVPSGRRPSGYRVYTADDLYRLRRILFYRELDFSLTAIRQMLAEPATTTDSHLRRQHQFLRARVARQQQLLDALEKEMEARQMGISLTPEEQFEIFGTDKLNEHMDEAGQRWVEGPEWPESKRRKAAYSKADWLAGGRRGPRHAHEGVSGCGSGRWRPLGLNVAKMEVRETEPVGAPVAASAG